MLVLGSMPGFESLKQSRYYAHARNRFWPMMESLLGIPAQSDYEEKIHLLNDAGVGLWDVIASCKREGSLDAGIDVSSEIYNEFEDSLRSRFRVSRICCNGLKAYDSFMRRIMPNLPGDIVARLEVFCLPSTSPANASFKMDDLLLPWSMAFKGLCRPYS